MRHYLDWLAETVLENWEKPALSDCAFMPGGKGSEYTYGGMYRRILETESLISRSGLQKGDHIAICGANSANWLVAYLAVAAEKCVSVPVLHTQTPDVIYSQIAFADCKALFVDEGIWDTSALPDLPSLMQVFSLDDFSVLKGMQVQASDGSGISREEVYFDTGPIDDLAQICFSSGTTDAPKAVMLSYGNLSNNILNAVETFPAGHNLNVLSTLPLAHIYGLMDEVLGHLPNGHHVHFVRQLSFGTFGRLLDEVNPYVVLTVPMLLEQLYLRKGKNISESLGGCSQIFVGGSKLDELLEDDLVALGLPLTTGYGSTETGPLISASRLCDYKIHSSARLVSGMEGRISDEGEILVRGANVMLGYYKDPEATRRKIDADGWLHTGDRGRIDEDNTVYVYGRLEQDMIVLPSGENVIPQDIETLLDHIDGVSESMVLERSGRLVALVYPSEGKCPDRDTLMRSVNIQLPSFSQLSDIEFVADPFQRTGKSSIKRYLYS